MKWNVERRSMKRLYIMKKLLGIVVLGLFISRKLNTIKDDNEN